MKSFLSHLVYYTMRPILGAPSEDENPDIYASAMLTDFNWIHNKTFPRFFSKIRLDIDSLANIKERLEETKEDDGANKQHDGAIPVYVTTNAGQLEYNYFNYLYLKESLPLAEFANDLSSWQWMPFHLAREAKITQLKIRAENGGSLPHPVSSGYVEGLILKEKSIFVSLRTSSLYDDLFWETPSEDILAALIRAQKKTEKPIMLIPQQFVWAKRPEKAEKNIIDIAFGDRERPGHFRKFILFWRNYKNHALVQFGGPFDLRDFVTSHETLPEDESARILRGTLLNQLKQERKRVTGPAIKPRKWIIEKIVESEEVQRAAYLIAEEKGEDVDNVQTIARKYADEMAADISHYYVERTSRIVNWVFRTMYDGINYDREGLAAIKKIMEKHPIVFVPNHLSHVDYLLTSTLLYGNDVSVPFVAAGINLSFWPLGKIFRRCGAFFIRRSFSGNKLYRAVFDTYLKILISEGNSIEFFIEGGRSRTGKLRSPKLGMISAITNAMFSGAADDLYFVPISITYDRVAEENVHVGESAGEEKKKERFTDIFKLGKYMKHRYGRVYVNFGDPISFAGVQSALPKEAVVPKIAHEIMSSLSCHSVVTPTAVVSTAFLISENRGVTASELDKNIELIISYLQSRKAQFSDTLFISPQAAIKDAITGLTSGKIIERHDDFDPVYYALPNEKRPNLDFQKNGIISHLLPVAYLSAALMTFLKEGKSHFKRGELNVRTEFIRSLLMCEFAAHSTVVSEEALRDAFEFLCSSGMLRNAPASEDISITATGTDCLTRYASIVRNYLDAYKVVYYTLSGGRHDELFDEKSIVKKMLANGKHLYTLGQIRRVEAISRPVYENAVRFFKTVGLLVDKSDAKGRQIYRWRQSNVAIQELQQQLELFS